MFTTRRPNSPKCVTMAPATRYMPETLLPPERNREANSTHRLSRLDIQRASADVKRFVESRLEKDFNLVKASQEISFHVFNVSLVPRDAYTMHFTDQLTLNPKIDHT